MSFTIVRNGGMRSACRTTACRCDTQTPALCRGRARLTSIALDPQPSLFTLRSNRVLHGVRGIDSKSLMSVGCESTCCKGHSTFAGCALLLIDLIHTCGRGRCSESGPSGTRFTRSLPAVTCRCYELGNKPLLSPLRCYNVLQALYVLETVAGPTPAI